MTQRLSAAMLACACSLTLAGAADAATIDMTTLTASYWTLPPGQAGAAYVNGAEPGWTIQATATQIVEQKDSSPELSGGPHVHIDFPNSAGNFVATVQVSVSDNTSNGNFFVQPPGGYAGIGFSSGGVGASYYISGAGFTPVNAGPVTYPLTLKLSRVGDTLTAAYAEGGAYSTLYTVTNANVEGNVGLDLTNYSAVGSIAPQTITFSNLTFTSVPEPGVWALLLMGLGAQGAALRRRRLAARG